MPVRSGASRTLPLPPAEWIQGTSNGETSKAYRTVFSVALTTEFANKLHGDNTLRFSKPLFGTDDDKCGITWAGEPNAGAGIGAKMETIATFTPTGIQWEERGVSFSFGNGEASEKGALRLHRKKIETSMFTSIAQGQRKIFGNDEDWVYDGTPDAKDAQYPTSNNPDRAFRIDAPGLPVMVDVEAIAYRSDFHEFCEWHNGSSEDGWSSISAESEGKWYADLTGGTARGNPTGHGPGHNATAIPNAKPVAGIKPLQGGGDRCTRHCRHIDT